MSVDTTALLDRHVPPGPLGQRAQRGRAWLAHHGFPTTRDEAWRYTPVDDVIAALGVARCATEVSTNIDRALVDDLAGRHGCSRLVFINGAVATHLSDTAGVEGLWLRSAADLRRRPLAATGSADQPADGFHALNWAAGRDVAAVLVEPGVHVDEPVHVVHISSPGDAASASHPRAVIRVGAGGRLHLIESYVGVGGQSMTNASTRIVVAAHAEVSYHRVQAETLDAIHVGRTMIDQAAGAQVRATSVMTGSRIARNSVIVRLTGNDARADLDGLYLPKGEQRHDTAITVDHLASRCTSTQRFKGIVDDHARGSFSGHVIVRPGTTATDASQSNHNLVLTPTAQADTRPWLEILADDVRCTHGAAVGRLDEGALFYLRSRGIPMAQARRMLVAAFAAAIVDEITPDSLREHVAALVAEPAPGRSS